MVCISLTSIHDVSFPPKKAIDVIKKLGNNEISACVNLVFQEFDLLVFTLGSLRVAVGIC